MATVTRVHGLNILLWNARGWCNKKEEVQKYLQDYDICIITEIKGRPNERYRMKGYRSICKNRINNQGRRIGGVVIFIKDTIKVEEIKNIEVPEDEIDCVGLRIKNIMDYDEVSVIGLYRKPGIITSRRTWRELLFSLKEEKNLLIAGDFNAYNIIWNCEDTDRTGETLWEEIDENELLVVNDCTKSRIGEGGVRNSNIDLMFSTRNIFQVIECNQLDDPWGSDHFP